MEDPAFVQMRRRQMLQWALNSAVSPRRISTRDRLLAGVSWSTMMQIQEQDARRRALVDELIRLQKASEAFERKSRGLR